MRCEKRGGLGKYYVQRKGEEEGSGSMLMKRTNDRRTNNPFSNTATIIHFSTTTTNTLTGFFAALDTGQLAFSFWVSK